MGDVCKHLIEPLIAIGFRWKGDEAGSLEGNIRAYTELFKARTDEDLKTAAQWFIMHRKIRIMPMPADIADVLEKVGKTPVAPMPERLAPWVGADLEARDFADRYLQIAPLARTAIEEGWPRNLHEHVCSLVRERLRRDEPLPNLSRFIATWAPSPEKLKTYRRYRASWPPLTLKWILHGRPEKMPEGWHLEPEKLWPAHLETAGKAS